MIIEGEPLIVKYGADRFVEIRPLLTSQRRRFRQYYAMAARFLSESQDNYDAAYDNNSNFRYSVAACLEIFGLDADDLDLRLIILLLFRRPVTTESGEVTWGTGLLIEWEFPTTVTNDDPTEAMEDIDPDLYDLTAAWMSDGGSLKEILELSEVHPHRDIAALVKTKYKVLEKHSDSDKGKSTDVLKPAKDPKIIGKNGQVEDFDMDQALAELKENMIRDMTGQEREHKWESVAMAGLS